ncbi:MAG: hypothetical protein FWH43_03450 [Endomicrobia bacterium]|nr:hypothetical protein [Endomicrobiia bacterium]
MKRKISALSAAFLFLAGVCITPVYCFVSDFMMSEKFYSDTSIKSFSNNTAFKTSQKINFEGFTKNILPNHNKTVDVSETLALMSGNAANTYFTSANSLQSGDIAYKDPYIYGSAMLDRLRGSPPPWQTESKIFIFFILSYIGMLRAVFVFYKKSNIFYIFNPLFVQTGVFYLTVKRRCGTAAKSKPVLHYVFKSGCLNGH